jgi:hypothetical protein
MPTPWPLFQQYNVIIGMRQFLVCRLRIERGFERMGAAPVPVNREFSTPWIGLHY